MAPYVCTKKRKIVFIKNAGPPDQPLKKYRHEKILQLQLAGKDIKDIAKEMKIHTSTIYQAITRSDYIERYNLLNSQAAKQSVIDRAFILSEIISANNAQKSLAPGKGQKGLLELLCKMIPGAFVEQKIRLHTDAQEMQLVLDNAAMDARELKEMMPVPEITHDLNKEEQDSL